jgi:hypothetical protein
MSSCLAELRERRGVGEQRTVDDVGEAALEGAQRLGGGVSRGGAPLDAVGQGPQQADVKYRFLAVRCPTVGVTAAGGRPDDDVITGAQPFDSALPAPIDPGQRLAR